MNYSLFDQHLAPSRKMALFSECSSGLHAFYRSSHKSDHGVLCRNCKSSIIDWKLTKNVKEDRIELIADELKKEWWRHYWWERELDDADLEKALNYSEEQLLQKVEKRISSSVGKIYSFNGQLKPFNDGYQTPFAGNIIYYAQHAMATCCRECIECWYGIPNGRLLTKEEINHLTALTLHYIKKRMHDV